MCVLCLQKLCERSSIDNSIMPRANCMIFKVVRSLCRSCYMTCSLAITGFQSLFTLRDSPERGAGSHTLRDPSPAQMSPGHKIAIDTGKNAIHLRNRNLFVTFTTDVKKEAVFSILQDTLVLTGQKQEVF